MSSEITSPCEETERKQKLIRIRQTIEEYINGNPETSAFRFFLPSTQDLDEVKQAAATTSLSTGKRIDLIYPAGITREGLG
jgi:hypothetical protein